MKNMPWELTGLSLGLLGVQGRAAAVCSPLLEQRQVVLGVPKSECSVPLHKVLQGV